MTEPRRRTVDMVQPDKDREDAPIRHFVEPSPESYECAIVAQTYLARELLGDVERQVNNGRVPAPKTAAQQATEALAYLRGAFTLLQNQSNFDGDSVSPTRSLCRAIHATEATIAQIGMYKSYDVTDGSELERKQLDHYHGVWRRAARAAKQEAHRALATLVELFPGTYEKDEP